MPALPRLTVLPRQAILNATPLGRAASPSLVRLVGSADGLGRMADDLLHPLDKIRPVHHDDAPAKRAADFDIRAHTDDRPAVAAAGMRLAHLHDVAQGQLLQGRRLLFSMKPAARRRRAGGQRGCLLIIPADGVVFNPKKGGLPGESSQADYRLTVADCQLYFAFSIIYLS